MILFLHVGLWMSLVFLPCDLFAAEPATQRLIAKGDRGYPPYEFINAAGEPDGFDIDLLKAISRQMKMDVVIVLDTLDVVWEELATGKIHMVTGMIRSAERERIFDFSISHAGVFYCLFVRKGSPVRNVDDIRGKEILVHAQAYSHDWLKERNISEHIIAVASPEEALRLLASGRHDGAVLERLSALELLRVMKIDTVAISGPPLACAPYAFAVRKGEDQLLARLNEGIHQMHQSGMYEDLYRKWFSVADAQARRMASIHVALFVLAAIIGLAVAIFIWNRSLKRTVTKKTAALRQSDRRFRQLSNLLPQTVFETDSKGQLSFLNQSGLDMLGLTEKSLNDGIHLSAFLPGLPELNTIVQDGGQHGEECVVRGPQIDPFPALLYITAAVPGAFDSGMRGLLVDITFQKELERQVIEAQKLEAMGRLAGGVAHDFSNIVTGISAYAQLIKTHPRDTESVADRADKILTGCERATDLARYFLATAGRRGPQKQRVRLEELVSEVFKLLQPTYGLNIVFENTIGSDNDAVWAEPAMVFQVLMNLCVNSAQAMFENGGALTVGRMEDTTDNPAGTMEPSKPAAQLVIFVQDTGPGIAPELRERIFDPFFTTKGQQKGRGIGLYVVSQALSDMGGSIRVDSVPGKETTFIVTLPAAR